MADIELVIRISQEDYKAIKDSSIVGDMTIPYVFEAIRNGKPIPKGHGKLVDLDKMCADYWDGNYMEMHKDDLKNIKTIIEADKREVEK